MIEISAARRTEYVVYKNQSCRTTLTLIILVKNKTIVYADFLSCKWNIYAQLSRAGNSFCHVDSSDSCIAYDLYVDDIKLIYIITQSGVKGIPAPAPLATPLLKRCIVLTFYFFVL